MELLVELRDHCLDVRERSLNVEVDEGSSHRQRGNQLVAACPPDVCRQKKPLAKNALVAQLERGRCRLPDGRYVRQNQIADQPALVLKGGMHIIEVDSSGVDLRGERLHELVDLPHYEVARDHATSRLMTERLPVGKHLNDPPDAHGSFRDAQAQASQPLGAANPLVLTCRTLPLLNRALFHQEERMNRW